MSKTFKAQIYIEFENKIQKISLILWNFEKEYIYLLKVIIS